ncbi:MAG: hypothetical protein QM723_11465 [Myxococcaceae bacterium]
MLFSGSIVSGQYFPDPIPVHRPANGPRLELELSLPVTQPAVRRCKVSGVTLDRGYSRAEDAEAWLVAGLTHTKRSLDDCFAKPVLTRDPLPIIWLRIEADRVAQAGINGADISTAERVCVERTLKSLPAFDGMSGIGVAFPYPDCQTGSEVRE